MAADLAAVAFMPYFKLLVELLETNKDLKKTAIAVLKQMGWGAAGTCAGGLVGGPPGALVGGIVGSVCGYFRSDSYDSMLIVIRNLTDSEKQELVKKVQERVGSTTLEALTAFIGSQVQREQLISTIQSVLKSKGRK